MTAEILRANVIKHLHEAREKHIKALRNCKYFPAHGTEKGIVQAVTAEQVAMFAVQTNSAIEVIDGVIELVEIQAKKILQPEESKVTELKPQRKRELY